MTYAATWLLAGFMVGSAFGLCLGWLTPEGFTKGLRFRKPWISEP